MLIERKETDLFDYKTALANESVWMKEHIESVVLMQPYFFPYLGYYSLIDKADIFIVCDEVQYIRQGWMNRNRILNHNTEFSYISMPVVKAPQKTAIKDIRIDQKSPWKEKLRQDLMRYRNHGCYYKDAMEVIEACLAYETDSLTAFHVNSIKQVMAYVGIEGRIEVLTDMKLKLPEIQCADEWGLYVTKALGGQTYYNPPGGMSFYSSQKYTQNGVEILFVANKLAPYNQGRDYFVASMSIIDAMMFLSPSQILEQVKNYDIQSIESNSLNQIQISAIT